MTHYDKILKSTSRLVPGSQLAAFAKSVVSEASSTKHDAPQQPQRRLVFVDASWYLPNSSRNGVAEFLNQRIKSPVEETAQQTGVVVKFGDIDGIKDPKSIYPHMLPSTNVFNESMKSLDIKKDDTVVVYDAVGNFSAPRMAWMLELFNKNSTFLLDTFPEYLSSVGESKALDTQKYSSLEAYSEATNTNTSAAGAASFSSSGIDESRVVSFEEMVEIVKDKDQLSKHIILDARPNGRFTGTDPEPRPGLSSGHVPGAKSLPFGEVLNQEKEGFNKFKTPEELIKIFEKRGVTKESLADKQLIVMCGTGVTACVLERAARIAGLATEGKKTKVYDGSWTEWAMRAPKELIVKS